MADLLVGLVVSFIIVGVMLMVGGAMTAITQNITLTIAPGSTLIDTLATNTGTALTTFGSLLPLVALAAVASIVFALLVGLRGTGTGQF